MFQSLFDVQVALCKEFPAFTPISLRREKAKEVFLLLARYLDYLERKGNSKKKVVRKRAGDDWF